MTGYPCRRGVGEGCWRAGKQLCHFHDDSLLNWDHLIKKNVLLCGLLLKSLFLLGNTELQKVVFLE